MNHFEEYIAEWYDTIPEEVVLQQVHGRSNGTMFPIKSGIQDLCPG